MPSPIGHTIAGFCGFCLVHRSVGADAKIKLLGASVIFANLPDVDILPGLLLGNPSMFHRQGTHSLLMAVVVGGLVALVVRSWKLSGVRWGIWVTMLYLSHLFLDLLVADSSFPRGVQLFWPFSDLYTISPITVFASFDYFKPDLGFLRSVLSSHNVITIAREVILMTPLTWCIYVFARNRRLAQSMKENAKF
ncbi:MAG: metal-dependent hydrolase [Cyanobacteria bacterium CRU_2_1]|nr:metal-dependent hydrolase [Cyanobacteria bacterium CRU_2_1]